MSLITSKVGQLLVFTSICISSFVSQQGSSSIFLFEHVSSFYANQFVTNVSYVLQIFSPKWCLTCNVIYGVFVEFGFFLGGLSFHCFLFHVFLASHFLCYCFPLSLTIFFIMTCFALLFISFCVLY